jgi:hypothetical protein
VELGNHRNNADSLNGLPEAAWLLRFQHTPRTAAEPFHGDVVSSQADKQAADQTDLAKPSR